MNDDARQTPVADDEPFNGAVATHSGGTKVIQPLDPNLKAESPITPVTAPAQPIAPQAAQTSAPAPQNTLQQTNQNSDSPHADAASGVASPSPSPPIENSTDQPAPGTNDTGALSSDKTRLLIVILVMALGVYTILPALLRLIGLGKLISLGFVSSSSVLVTVLDVIYLAIGIGLILRKEIARAAYVFFAIIFLLFALYGTFKIYSQEHSQSTSQGNLRAQLQYDISYCLTKPPSAERNATIRQLENDVNTNRQPTKTCSGSTLGTGNQYVALIPSYLLAIFPFVFLTIPRVKQVFN